MTFSFLTKRLADPGTEGSVSSWARRRRWAEFEQRFPDIAEMSVLDLGGTSGYWTSAPVRPASLTLLNLFEQPPPWEHGARVVVGNACEPPSELSKGKFDLVVCNSVIGSVGGHEMRRRLAEVVRTHGEHYWVQTPNRYFPVDPIFLFPLFPLLPFRARLAVSCHWPLGQRQAESPEAGLDHVLTIEYLTEMELRYYFPKADLWRERFAGMVKSLVAVR